MFVNKLKMDEIAEAVKKCMDEADLEETGLRKAAYAAHTKGEKMFSFKGKTYPVKVQGEDVSYGKEMKEESCEDVVKKHEKRLHGKDGEVSKHVDKMHKEELSTKQKKIAKLEHPKDKIDAGDLAKLRGEEVELDEVSLKTATSAYVKRMGDDGSNEKSSQDKAIKTMDHIANKHGVRGVARAAKTVDDKYGLNDPVHNPRKAFVKQVMAGVKKEEVELDEADKVATSTGMKVYGSSYGDSAKARRDQLKRPVDDTKGPNKSQLAQMAKVKKEEFFKDRLITNYIEEESLFEAELQEVLSKDATAGEWISDFVHSDNPKFEGKSKKMRQKMALAAYYAKKNESVDDSYPVTTDTVAGRMPGGMANTFKQFKVKVSAKDREAAETKNRIPNSDPMNMTAREPHVGHGGLVSIPPAGVVHKEEVERIEELKKSTLGSYVKKASKDLHNTSFDHGEDEHRQYGEPDGPYGDPDAEEIMKKRERDIENRQKGINRAATKLSKEEVEHLNEDDFAHAKKQGWSVSQHYHHTKITHPKHGIISVDRYGEWMHHPDQDWVGRPKGNLIAHGQDHDLNKHLSSLKEETEINEDNLDSIAKKHGMELRRTTYGAGMKHKTKGEVSINRYGEWNHYPAGSKSSKAHGDSSNNFSSLNKHLSSLNEATPPKNTDIADKSYLKDMGKKPTVKSDIKNFGRFLAGKKETNEEVELEEAVSRKDFQMVADLIKTHDNHDKRKELATHHAEIFHRQNPRFDRAKFMKAADVNEGKQPETDNVPFIPFEGPYTKTPSNVKDKSGAVHTPMSRARDLAKAAMKRVKTEMLGKAPGNNG